jgi:hypothetical protein
VTDIPANGPVDEGLTDGTFIRIPFRSDLGPDPLAERPQPWPAWTINQKRTLASEEALRGWRFWRIGEDEDGPALISPFVDVGGQWEKWARISPRIGSFSVKDITWKPGLNVARHFPLTCSQQDIVNLRGLWRTPEETDAISHRTKQMGRCGCGICVMRSLTVLRALDVRVEMGESSAYAEVDVWGQVVPRGRYQVRAEYAQLAGPLHIARTHRPQADALTDRYHVGVVVLPFDLEQWLRNR